MTEQQFAEARERMVREQLIPHHITDSRVLAVMGRVSRHRFVPPEFAEQAYEDHPVPIGLDQTISQPLMVAMMAQMLHLTDKERVLDVGTGSGYQAAVLGELAAEVISIERHPELAARAEAILQRYGARNVTVVVGDGTLGYPPRAPYDRIIVAAASNRVPQQLIDQLAPNSRLIIPVGPADIQTLTVITTDANSHAYTHEHGGCLFVPLIHDH